MSKSERKKEEKKKKSKDQRKRAFQAMRTGDLNRLFAKRYHGTREDYVFPDDDAGIDDLRILLGHYALFKSAAPNQDCRLACTVAYGSAIQYIMADAITAPRMWNLTEAERCDLGIRTIGTIDVTSKQRKQARKVRDKNRKATARRAKGAKPHAESAGRLKPWEAEGISRRTYYRRRQKAGGTGGTNSSTVNLIKAADEVVPRHLHDRSTKNGPDSILLLDTNKPATSTKQPKKVQTLEMSEARRDEPLPPENRKAP